MFEKEAEEYAEKGGLPKEKYLYGLKAMSFKDGAEFGYNFAKEEIDYLNKHWRSEEEIKTNEWHYVKDGDLPKISDSTIRTLKPVIVAVVNGIETSTYGTYWNVHTGKFECLDKVYAWCDSPEPPELKENE